MYICNLKIINLKKIAMANKSRKPAATKTSKPLKKNEVIASETAATANDIASPVETENTLPAESLVEKEKPAETIKDSEVEKAKPEPKKVLKSSNQWLKESGEEVLVYSGWDRSNLEASLKEKITKEEFDSRLKASSVKPRIR